MSLNDEPSTRKAIGILSVLIYCDKTEEFKTGQTNRLPVIYDQLICFKTKLLTILAFKDD